MTIAVAAEPLIDDASQPYPLSDTGGRLVSVVIIFLNGLPFLEEALASVFAQTYPHWELLLVDDGSDDGSTAIAKAAVARNPGQVRYLEHPAHANHGMSASRNLGLHEARGDYVAFLDADDAWLPEKLAVQVRVLESRPDVDLVYGNSLIWFSWTGEPDDVARDCFRGTGIAPGTVVAPPGMLIRCFPLGPAPSPATSGYMVRREVLKGVGGSEVSFGGMFEDQALLAKLYLKANILVTDDRLDKYRMHPMSCVTLAVTSGQLNKASAAFLSWLEGFLDQNDQHDPVVRRLLRAAAWPHRHPRLHSIQARVQRLRRRASRVALVGTIRLARAVAGRSTGRVTANPNPAITADRFGAIVTTVSWDVRGATAVEVRVGSPAGALLVASGPVGQITTGKWVTNDMVFYLQDVSDGCPLDLRHTIDVLAMQVGVASQSPEAVPD